MTRLGKNGKAKSDRFRKAWNPESIRIRSAPSGWRSSSDRKKLSRGASLRGQGTPADPARLRSERARNLSKTLYIAGRENLWSFGLRISRRLRTFESPCARRLRLLFPKIYFTFPRPRAGIRTARSRQPRRPLLRPAVRCAGRARGSAHGPVPPV